MSEFVILHKKKDTLNRLCCIMKVTKQTEKLSVGRNTDQWYFQLCYALSCAGFKKRWNIIRRNRMIFSGKGYTPAFANCNSQTKSDPVQGQWDLYCRKSFCVCNDMWRKVMYVHEWPAEAVLSWNKEIR